jgi:hypothetical protein
LHATTTSRWVAASAFAACLALGGGGGSAWAKDSDGTKQDKKFGTLFIPPPPRRKHSPHFSLHPRFGTELCVSKCVFLATKPPPMGSDTQRLEETSSRTRVEILRDCRSDCATTKEQRLLGKPKAPKPTQQ